MALNIRPTKDCLKINLRVLMILHAAAVFLFKSVFERRAPIYFEVHIELKLHRADTQRNLIQFQ
jgi:hypothetical protein